MMANKKPSKNVIDYDPLAWLSEENDEEESETVDQEDAKAPEKAQTGDASTTKKSSKKPQRKKSRKSSSKAEKTAGGIDSTNVATESAEQDDNASFGFFDDEAAVDNNAPDESAAFGFFDQSDDQQKASEGEVEMSVETEPESQQDADENSAYGFFDEADGSGSQTARIDGESNVIHLGADLTIRSVAACKELIDQSLSSGFDIRLAAGDLQKIDSAGLQLLFSLKTTLEKTAQSIQWESGNSIINEAAGLIGMPSLCDAAEDEEAGYGFFNDDKAPSGDNAGYGFF